VIGRRAVTISSISTTTTSGRARMLNSSENLARGVAICALVLTASCRSRSKPAPVDAEALQPVTVTGRADTTLALSKDFACALDEGFVSCWWRSSAPKRVPGLSRVAEIAGADGVVVARDVDGAVWKVDPQDTKRTAPARYAPFADARVRRIVADRAHVCALTFDGDVSCDDEDQPFLGRVANGVDVVRGGDLTCVLDAQGALFCKGVAREGVLGTYPVHSPGAFERRADLESLAEIQLFSQSACLRFRTRRMWCSQPPTDPKSTARLHSYAGDLDETPFWFELGDAQRWAIPRRALPADVPAVEVASSSSGACARAFDGTIRCWGVGNESALPESSGDVAREIPALSYVREIGVGPDSACAVVAGGTVWCWGWGIVRDGRVTRIDALANAVHVAVSYDAICVVRQDGHVRCRRRIDLQGATADADVDGPTNVVEIEASRRHFCARSSSGDVWCWAFGSLFLEPMGGKSQLDDPSAVGADPYTQGKVIHVDGVTAKSLALAYDRSCAVLDDGDVACWGGGRLDVEYKDGPLPRRVPDLHGVDRYAIGDSQCARFLTSGEWACETRRSAESHYVGAAKGPAPHFPDPGFHLLPGKASIRELTTTGWGLCVLDSTGSLDCDEPGWVKLSGIASFGGSAGGGCALRAKGTVVCWGMHAHLSDPMPVTVTLK